MKHYIYIIAAFLLILSGFIGCAPQASQLANVPSAQAFSQPMQVSSTETVPTETVIASAATTPYEHSDSSTVTRSHNKAISLVGSNHVSTIAPAIVAADNVTLLIDSGAVSHDVEISILAATEEQSGVIPNHLANLTANGAVYRMLPDGQRFERDITIAMRYDSTALPYGYTADDIYTFFYNEEAGLWQQVERDSVDTQKQIVYSRTNHFTDYINGVLKVPESSDAMAYTPTSIKDLKAADPLDGIPLIAPPEANNQGTANLTYPLTIPAGRRGMQPHLAVTYNSAGGSGILGLGWSLPISEISVETRWGVPLYSDTLETEAYMLDGEMLVTSYTDENNNLRLNKPVYHRAYEPRFSSDTLRFYPRVEGSFRKIERIGTSPDNYHWMVTDKDGTRHFYGTTSQSRLSDNNGNIAKWMLEKSIDTYGNTISYIYTTKLQYNQNERAGRQLCIDRIRYTGKDRVGDLGQYIVRFHYADKHDTINSFRYGLEEINNYILDRVEVMFRDSIVREYYFGYTEGEFGKTLLCTIYEGYDDSARSQRYNVSGQSRTIRDMSVYDRCSVTQNDKNVYPHIVHSFDYYSLDGDSLFSEPVTLSFGEDLGSSLVDVFSSILYEKGNFGGSSSKGFSVGGGLNVGAGLETWLKARSMGGHYSFSKDFSKGVMAFVDINGDGYPDKIFRDITGDISCRLQDPTTNSFTDIRSVDGIERFQKTSTRTHNWGIEATSLDTVGVGVNWSNSRSTTSVYFTDVNGDGLVDIVDNGSVYINRGNLAFDNVTSNDTIEVVGSCGDNYYDFSGEVDTSLFEDGFYTVEREICEYKIDTISSIDTIVDTKGSYTLIPASSIVYENNLNCRTVVDTIYYSYPRSYEPNIDLVRMWKAPYDGVVVISGTAQLSDSLSHFRIMTRTNDGVWLSVQKASDTTLLASEMVYPGDEKSISCRVSVNSGDTLYFRINAAEKRLYDAVVWNPNISYSVVSYADTTIYPRIFPQNNHVDANNKPLYSFDYDSDFMLNGNTPVSLGDTSGNICYNAFEVKLNIKSSHKLSQDIVYSLVRENPRTTFQSNTNVDTLHMGRPFAKSYVDTIVVPSSHGLYLQLRPQRPGQVDWSDIQTDATVTLLSSSSHMLSEMLQDSNKRGAFVYHPVVVRDFFDYRPLPGEPIRGIGGTPVLYLTVKSRTTQPFNGILYLTIKNSTNTYFNSAPVFVTNGHASINAGHFYFNSTGTYFVDCYCDPISADTIKAITVRVGSDNEEYCVGLYSKYSPDSQKHHGTLYRGWGQFGYKPDAGQPNYIKRSLTKEAVYYNNHNAIPTTDDNTINSFDTSAVSAISDPETDAFNGFFNPLAGNFFEMMADGKNDCWISYGNAVAARRGLCSLDNYDMNADIDSVEVDMFQSPLPVVLPGQKIKTVNRQMSTKGHGYTIKQFSFSTGHSEMLGDFMDMNGDRYPDILSEKGIQYSKAQGGLGNLSKGYSTSGDLNRSTNMASGISYNGSFLSTGHDENNKPSKSHAEPEVSDGNIGASICSDSTETSFMDVNADGLPDIVYYEGKVQYNTGYGFTGKRDLDFHVASTSSSISESKSMSVNICGSSIKAGLNSGVSKNESTNLMLDANGDGLPDRITQNSIYINKGGHFVALSDMDHSITKSFSLNAAGTFDIPFGAFKTGVSLSASGTASLNLTGAQFIDLNNDGYVDFVFKKMVNSIKVCYSRIGKANLLKSVSNFANAKYYIDYDLSVSTVDCPHRHWNMASLSVYDGHPYDGTSTVYKRFEYGNRHYDRFERDDYGYDTVKTYDYASQSAFVSNSVDSRYRTYTQVFYNDNYYHAHLKKSDRVSKGNTYVETRYTYADADIVDGHYLNDNTPSWCKGDGWPAVAVEESFHNEGSNGIIATKREYTYGSFGNITDVADFGNTADTSDDYNVHIDYAVDAARHIVANVSQVEIPGYRRRQAFYNTHGSIDSLVVYNDPDPRSLFSYQYDQYGNIAHVTTPATAYGSDSIYWIHYVYDSLLHMLPIYVTNVEGHASTAHYSYRWQAPFLTVDISNNPMRYTYDSHGRISTITAPNEINSNIPYTVKYDYWYSRSYANPIYNTHMDSTHGLPYYPWARTRNYDPEHPDNDINTVTFCDGLGRIIQVKKDVEVAGTEVRAVGGTVHYDGLGRKRKEFLLKQETDLQVFDTLLNVQPAQWQTQYTYDFLDRVVQIDYADSSTSHSTYSVAQDYNGFNRIVCAYTDQNGHTSYIYSDTRQQKTQTTDALGATTLFYYDAIGQLRQSVDPEGNVTEHIYDHGGRRTDRIHPSAGHTHWDYDAAGNMVKLTQNSGELIKYDYDFSRPVHIAYSNRPWNNVWYEYGTAGSGNQAGRLTRQQDASGVQEFRYDCMGNVEYNRHTFIQPHNSNTLTLATRWKYDSWGRVVNIVYPDQDSVTYHYNYGGMLLNIEGNKPGYVGYSSYISRIKYNIFGQRIQVIDGDDVESKYEYNQLNLRMTSMRERFVRTNEILQDVHYYYDLAGNIDSIVDLGRNPRVQRYGYDDADRLIGSKGQMSLSRPYYPECMYSTSYKYSPAGRLLKKFEESHRISTTLGDYHVINDMTYSYSNPDNPFAVGRISVQNGGNFYFGYDSNGNICKSTDQSNNSECRLGWTEDNRLQSFYNSSRNGDIAAYYNYSANGERNLKLTSARVNIIQNGSRMEIPANPIFPSSIALAYPTLYASSLVTLTKHGYTKHYFEEGRRICSKVGGGMRNNVTEEEINDRVEIVDGNYPGWIRMQNDGVYRSFRDNIGSTVAIVDNADLHGMLVENEILRDENEPAYFYHSDHLGSTSFITCHGNVTQTLNYLPYGEDWVEYNTFDPRDTTRLGIYRFNGKEKDYESGFHYYGARYYWSEALTGWLSVDPMSDKYSSISPYAYCIWNPVKLVDPNGMDTIIFFDLDNGLIYRHEDTKRIGLYLVQMEHGENTTLYSGQTSYDKVDMGNSRTIISFKDACQARKIYDMLKKESVQFEWNIMYLNDGSADLVTSALPDKIRIKPDDYSSENVDSWRHYHPSLPNYLYWMPSKEDQLYAKKLGLCPSILDFCGQEYDFAPIIKEKGVIDAMQHIRYREILKKMYPTIIPYCD